MGQWFISSEDPLLRQPRHSAGCQSSSVVIAVCFEERSWFATTSLILSSLCSCLAQCLPASVARLAGLAKWEISPQSAMTLLTGKQGAVTTPGKAHATTTGSSSKKDSARGTGSAPVALDAVVDNIVCVKCEEECPRHGSSATGGANPLRRQCQSCAACDKGLTRVPGARQAMKKKTREEKLAVYRKSKREREKSTNGRVERSYEDIKGLIGEENFQENTLDDLDKYITYTMFEDRQRTRGEPLENIPNLWKDELNRPGAQTLQRRGEWLLGEFNGVEVRNRQGSRQGSSVVKSSSVKTANDMQAFQREAEESRQKRAKLSHRRLPAANMAAPASCVPDVSDIPLTDVVLRPFSDGLAMQYAREAEANANEMHRENNLIFADLIAKADQSEARRDAALKLAQEKGEKAPDASDILDMETNLLEQLATVDTSATMERRFAQTTILQLEAFVRAEVPENDPAAKTDADHIIEQIRTALKDYTDACAVAKTSYACMQDKETQTYKESSVTVLLLKQKLELLKEARVSSIGKKSDVKKAINESVKTALDWIKSYKKKADKMNATRSRVGGNTGVIDDIDVDDFPLADDLRKYCEEQPIGGSVNTSDNPHDLALKKVIYQTAKGTGKDIVDLAFAQTLMAMPYYANQKSWTEKHLKSKDLDYINAAISKKPIATQIRKEVTRHLPSPVFSDLTIADDPTLSSQIFDQQFYLRLGDNQSVSYTHFCMGECTVTLEGSESFAGVRARAVPGKTLAEKKKNIETMKLDPFLALVKQYGFMCWPRNASVVIIPAGYLVIRLCGYSCTSCTGLRWSFSESIDQQATVLDGLKELIASYPDILGGTPYEQFMRWMDVHVPSSVKSKVGVI